MATLGGLQAGLSSYTPTWAERIPNAIQDGLTGLGMDKYTARRVFAQPVADALSWSPVGAVTGAVDQARAAFNAPSLMGKLAHGGMAAMNMAALPFPGAGGAVARVAERGAAHVGEHLAMDEGSRMARAAEQGFDPSRTLYHGTHQDFDAFKVGTGGVDELGKGIYATSRPDHAAAWSREEGGRIMPLLMAKGGVFDYANLSSSAKIPRDAVMSSIAKRVQARGSLAATPTDSSATTALMSGDVGSLADHISNTYDNAGHDGLNEWLSRSGYVGAKDGTGEIPGQVVAFDPANIRSKFAAFDPRNAGSANLLGGLAAGVVGAKYLSQPSPDTQQPQ